MKARLDEDLGNMEPAELEPAADTGVDNSEATDSEVVDALPEVECSKMRVGTFCAILEGVIDDIEEEKASDPNPEVAEEPVTEKEIDEVAEPVIEQAVALAIVPSSVRKMYQKLKAQRLRINSRRAALLASAAHWVAEAVTEVEGGDSAASDPAYNAGADKIDNPITAAPDASGEIADSLSQEDESIAEGSTATTAYYKRKMQRMFGSLEGDTAVDDPAYNAGADKIDNPITAGPDASSEIKDALSQEDESLFEGETKTTAYYKNKMHRLFGSLEGDSISIPAEDIDAHDGDPINVTVDGGIDKASTACLRALARSAVAHRQATSQVSKRISGVLLNRMLHELRYTLPASFLKKYR